MPEPLRPAATKTYGRDSWVLLTAADINAITSTEWNAASSLDITSIAFASTGKPSQTTNRVTQERRLGDTRVFEFVGTSTVVGGTLTYAFAAQAAAMSDGKKLFEKIPEGSTFILANRRGIPKAVSGTTGQFYNAYPVEFGPSFPADAGADEAAESAMAAEFAVTGPVAINKAIA